jgi:hypothetical protein
MWTLDSTSEQWTPGQRADHHDGDAVGTYLTDGVFLYRVAGSTVAAGYRLVELEDCYGLDRVRVPVACMRARRLRVVTPAGAHASVARPGRAIRGEASP